MSKPVVAAARDGVGPWRAPRFEGSDDGTVPNGKPPARPFHRLAGSPLALAAWLIVAGSVACGGTNSAHEAVIEARVRSAPADYRAGEPFGVTITFENTGTADVSLLQLHASAGSAGVTVTPGASLPTALAPGSSVDVTWTVSAGDAGPLTISFRATGASGTGAAHAVPLEITVTVSLTQRVSIAASAGPNGDISPSGAVAVPYGGSQTFAITPAAGHRVADVVIDGASVGPVTTYTFSAVMTDHAIGATFAVDTRTITASTGANGGISPSGAVTVSYGGSRTFTIMPAANHHVGDVLVDGASVGPVTTYTFSGVTENHTIGATFAVDTRTITASAGSNGLISPSGAVAVPYGGSQTFAITPATGHRVADVVIDGASVGPVTTYTFSAVTTDHAIGATFAVDTRTITASAGANGGISPSGAVTVSYGGSRTFTIMPAANHHVGDVLVDGASVGPVTTYTFSGVTANHTIGATFAVDTRTITASAGSNGLISPSGAVAVPYGGSQTFTITPAAGYHVEDLVVDGAWPGSMTTYTFDDVVADHSIRALFSNRWEITATAGENGSISPSGTIVVGDGGSQAFNITPAAHHHVDDVVVDGASVGPVTTYTFDGVAANHAIGATFAVDTRIVTANAGAHGSISPSGAVAVPYGGSQTFAMEPASGYHVADVQVDGASIGAPTQYTFSDITASHTISATFVIGEAPRAVFFGSSTTEGAGASDTTRRWTSLVAACFGWTEVNQGMGGSTMTMLDASGTSAEARWPDDVVARRPDIVVIQYGANDVMELVPLGAPDQSQTFRHATHVVLGGIAGALPSAAVYVIEPQPAIALGADREPYDGALAEGATAFALPIVHAGEAFPAGGQYASDQIHLNDAGHSALARYVANRIAAIEGWTMPACTF